MKMFDQLKNRALSLGGQAVGKLLQSPERAEKVAAAFGAVQRGKKRVDAAQGAALHAMGFAHAGDYKDLRRRISAAKRQAEALLQKLERLG